MILRGYTFKNKPKIKCKKEFAQCLDESFEKSIDEINQNLTNTISLINEYSKTKQRILSIQNKIKKKTNFIPFLRTGTSLKIISNLYRPSMKVKKEVNDTVSESRDINPKGNSISLNDIVL